MNKIEVTIDYLSNLYASCYVCKCILMSEEIYMQNSSVDKWGKITFWILCVQNFAVSTQSLPFDIPEYISSAYTYK